MPKTVLIYLLLVGIPVIGVSLVLKAGKDLKPPVSFSGSWEIEAWPDSVCSSSADRDTLGMYVEQSGPQLAVRFNKGIQLVGRVEGDEFRAWGENRVRVQGRRVRDSAGYRFQGVILGAPCPGATRTVITGTRLHPAGRATTH